jgi:hypothetical protein
LDSDSGSEFLNGPLVEYCAAQRITFTRGRPYRKNDSCFVEQKNWAVVRRLVGYQRLEAPALAALQRVHELSRDYVNFLHPVRKLTEKVRRGARITRRYDAAQTPYRRLLASGVLSPAKPNVNSRPAGQRSIHSGSNWSSNPLNVPSPGVQYIPSSLTPFGRKRYEATSASLVGSFIDASRNCARHRLVFAPTGDAGLQPQ